MTQEHPITPLPELVEKWVAMIEFHDDIDVFTDVARWGADQELEACCEWLHQKTGRWDLLAELRTARRPKPPSLKEQALKALETLPKFAIQENADLVCVIRRALESLPE